MQTLRWWIATLLFATANNLSKLEHKINRLGLDIGWGKNRHADEKEFYRE